MNKNRYIAIAMASVIIANAAGYYLKINDLDRYLIFLGFRFHLSLVLPFLLMLPFIKDTDISGIFSNPPNKKYYMPFVWILFPLAVSAIAPLLAGIIELNDPDYYYEFGLSSVVDFPVYLFWNLPQLFAIAFFILAGIKAVRLNIGFTAILMIGLFIYEFVPLPGVKYDYITPACFAAIAIPAAFVLAGLRNIYLFSAMVFSELWCGILAFGSSSKTMINMLFARQYSSWDGFFSVNKQYSGYALLIFFGISMAVILFSTALADKEKRN